MKLLGSNRQNVLKDIADLLHLRSKCMARFLGHGKIVTIRGEKSILLHSRGVKPKDFVQRKHCSSKPWEILSRVTPATIFLSIYATYPSLCTVCLGFQENILFILIWVICLRLCVKTFLSSRVHLFLLHTSTICTKPSKILILLYNMAYFWFPDIIHDLDHFS